jgi:hypothetical protein
MIMSFKAFCRRYIGTKKSDPQKIRVEMPKALFEATRAKIGRFTARRDPPHFQGDEYHAHADVPGGEVCWGVSGRRRHPNKFPAHVPDDARSAVAAVLEIDPDLLEAYEIDDELIGEKVLLLEVRDK